MKIKGCKGINIVQNIKIKPSRVNNGGGDYIYLFWHVVKVANFEDCIDAPGAEAI